MTKRILLAIGLAVLGLLMAAGCGHHATAPRPVTVKVMVLPDYSLNVMTARVAPLVAYLQRSLGPGYRVEWISCPSPEAFMATAERERPDVSLQDAYHTGWLMRLQQAEPIMRAVLPGGGARAMIVAAADGPVRTLADLAGRIVAIPSRRSYSGYIAQAAYLEAEANIHAASIRFVPVRWSDQVEASVRRASTDAGFMAETDLLPGMRVLARTDPVPGACVVTFPHTDAAVGARICSALAELSTGAAEGSAVLRGLEIQGFAPIDAAARREIVQLAGESPVPY